MKEQNKTINIFGLDEKYFLGADWRCTDCWLSSLKRPDITFIQAGLEKGNPVVQELFLNSAIRVYCEEMDVDEIPDDTFLLENLFKALHVHFICHVLRLKGLLKKIGDGSILPNTIVPYEITASGEEYLEKDEVPELPEF